MRGVLFTAIALSIGLPAMAQAPPSRPPDPRLAGVQMQALQSLLTLREAELRALGDDNTAAFVAREKAWAEAFKGWCGERPACGLTPDIKQ